MKISDYDILKRFLNDINFSEFIREHGDGKAVPLLMHHLSEKYGYSQQDSYRMAQIMIKELVLQVRSVNSAE